MANRQSASRYSTATIALHWLTLLLVVAVYACIELRGQFPRGSEPREALKAWHFMLGLTVLGLTFVRVAARLHGGTPPVHPPLTPLQARAAALGHVLLYAFLLAMPLLGWLVLSTGGKPIPFFGLQLPALTGKDAERAALLKTLHEAIGTAGYALIGLHAAAALYHHYVRRDDVVRRMLPGGK